VTDELDAKLLRISDRVQARAVTARDELEAYGWLATSGYLRERFGTQKFWLRTPRVEHGNPIFDGCDLCTHRKRPRPRRRRRLGRITGRRRMKSVR
jgi:hypothetical protein